MIILAHRGFWLNPEEKNTLDAFERAWLRGWGVEIDVRDCAGKLVISHDPPRGHEPELATILARHATLAPASTLAVNIKADGLHRQLGDALKSQGVQDYFLFDMSTPDHLVLARSGFRCFTRQSEIEPDPILYDQSEGVWLDEFSNHWIDVDIVRGHQERGKRVAIVSPELHGREYDLEWRDYRDELGPDGIVDLMLCTDHPDKAEGFFK
ncbi:MAG: hypothetical protein HQ481_16050 [Alphaproteobacteria bacterium]|nr:hypothetical protein [Alphaproteobacteria bacterium]